jgi:hypothetical protein
MSDAPTGTPPDKPEPAPRAEEEKAPTSVAQMSVGDVLKLLTPLDYLIGVLAAALAATFFVDAPSGQRADNEAAVLGFMRRIPTMQERFQQKTAETGLARYASSFLEMAQAGALEGPAPDGAFLTRDGYVFKLGSLGDPDHYFAIARPERFGGTGERSFYIDDTGVVRAAPGPVVGPAFPEAH